jgi:hypothetical protein
MPSRSLYVSVMVYRRKPSIGSAVLGYCRVRVSDTYLLVSFLGPNLYLLGSPVPWRHQLRSVLIAAHASSRAAIS